MKSYETPIEPNELQHNEETTPKKRQWWELRDEVAKELGLAKGYTGEEMMRVTQGMTEKILIAGGAKMIFDEDGNSRIEPTTEQIDQIKNDWASFVTEWESRVKHSSDQFLLDQISKWERPERRRTSPVDQISREEDRVMKYDLEQLERAAFKEILKKRQLAREKK